MGGRAAPVYVEPTMPHWWDQALLVSTVAALGMLLVDMGLPPDGATSILISRVDLGFCLLFITDFGLRYQKATNKWRFVKRNWIDLLGAIPLVGPFRVARAVRLVRLVRMTRVFALSIKLLRRRGIRIPSGALANLGLATGIMWVAAAGAFYYFEHGSNDGIKGLDDALWWSMTTLSTVGYGDLYPGTDGGRLVAGTTMVVGIGVLGTLAATIATAFIEVRERARRGAGSYRLKNHLLVLGWNAKSAQAIEEFRQDARYQQMPICIVADIPETPVDDPAVRFIRGVKSKREVLKRASPERAALAIIFARDPNEQASDHETALTVHLLRRFSKSVRISAELVDAENHEHLTDAGCDAVIDISTVITNLMVRSVQDVGVSDVVTELLSAQVGCEIYRVPVSSEMVGKDYRELATSFVDQGCCLLGIAREGHIMVNPKSETRLSKEDEAFVVSHEPIA